MGRRARRRVPGPQSGAVPRRRARSRAITSTSSPSATTSSRSTPGQAPTRRSSATSSNDFEHRADRSSTSRRIAAARRMSSRSRGSSWQLNPPIFATSIVPRADRASTFPVQHRRLRDRRPRGERGSSTTFAAIARSTAIGGATSPCCIASTTSATGSRPRSSTRAFPVASRRGARSPTIRSSPTCSPPSRVIANPNDESTATRSSARYCPARSSTRRCAKSEGSRRESAASSCARMAARLPRADESARQIRRALADWKNLEAVGKQHSSLARAGHRTAVAPRGQVALGARRPARRDQRSRDVCPMSSRSRSGSRDARSGTRRSRSRQWGASTSRSRACSPTIGIDGGARRARPRARTSASPRDDTPSVGLALGVFKAAQLIEMSEQAASFTNFTAVDLETTDRDTASAEIVEIAAVRVRDGVIVDQYSSLVKPRVPIAPGATDTHGIGEAELRDAPYFEDVWPAFRAFCGDDVIVAHNGYDFDFKIISRMARGIGAKFDLCTYDSLPLARDSRPTSHKLVDLARQFGIDTGQSHRALDDTHRARRTCCSRSSNVKRRARARRRSSHLLDHLGVALALSRRRADDARRRDCSATIDARLRARRLQRRARLVRAGVRRRHHDSWRRRGDRAARRRGADGEDSHGEDRRRALSRRR